MPLFILLLCFTYAACRYVIFGEVAYTQLPAYVSNKAFAFSIAALLLMSALKQKHNSAQAASYGRWAWHLLLLHTLISATLFSAVHYPKFFDGEMSNANGQLLLLAGVIGAYGFYRLQHLKDNHQLKALCALLLVAHVLPMGGSWFSAESWPGYMPPVSLLSFIMAGIASWSFLRQ